MPCKLIEIFFDSVKNVFGKKIMAHVILTNNNDPPH